MKVNAARPKHFIKVALPIFIGALVSILGQSSLPPVANALYFGTGYNAAVAGNAGGGNQNGLNACATDMVAVGVGLTVNGSSPGFGIYCRAIGSDGQLVAQDQSSASNTTAVGGGNSKVFCPAGKVVTGISFIIWTNVAIRCATPPSLSDNSALIWFTSTTSTPASTNCSTGGIVAGFFTRTGAWTDAIGAYCLPYSLNTLSYNVNGGGGTAPASQTQTAPAQTLTVTSSYIGTRTGFHFDGWNTLANGLGTDYANGSSIRPIGATSLYAKWTSTISYNGNTNSSGAVPLSTEAVSSVAITQLSPNNGSSTSPMVPLAKTGFSFAGWNTRADGKGTSYTGYGYSDAIMDFKASDYNTSTKVWVNSATTGATYDVSSTGMGTGTGITKATTSANVNGNTASFTTLSGLTTSRITFPNSILDSYTLCHVSRYASTTTSKQQRIIGHATFNWLSGNLSGKSGSYYGSGNYGNGNVDSNSGATTNGALNDTDWHLYCDYSGGFRMDGTVAVATGRQTLPANISINTWSNQQSEWEIAEILIFNRALDASGIKYVESQLATTYGLSGYSSGTGTYASTGDITLYAQWNSTITYNGNGQTSATNTVPAETIATGTAANTTLAAPTTLLRTNFTFDGWNTAANGSGTSYAAGLTTYASTGSTTLYAQWKAPITFNGNTNSGGTAPATVNAITSTITLPSNSGSLTKTGYAFSGWNTAANGSGINYAAGDSYPITGQATLYANWTPSNTGLTPSFNTNTSSPIGVVASTGYVINTVYTNNANDLVLSQYADKIQIIATVPAGTLAITTTTNLTLPTGYQAALNTADATISFIGNLADVNAALASLRYVSPSTAVSTTISVYAAYAGINGDYRYNPTTGSSYWRGASAVVWADANNPTTASSNCGVSFNGMCGYMTVPNDAAETQWVASKLGTGWIGITDATQGAFKYLPNAPNGNGSASFTYFASGEGTIAAEQYVAIYYANGYWVDLSTQSMNALYEFGGKSETPIFASLTRTIAIGALVAPNAPTLDSASDSGTSNSDKITNDNTPTINIGGLTVGATVTLTATPASGTAVTCTFVPTTTSGSCTFSTIPNGTYSIVATQTLGGTTTAGSAALANVQIDTVRPTVTLSATVGAGTNVASGANDTIALNTAVNTYTIKATFSESVSGLLISEITKDAASTGWTVGSTLTGSGVSYTFTATNSGVVVNTAGKLLLRIAEGVALDVAGNTNTATTSDFVINSVARVDFWDCGPLGQYCTGGAGPASITQATSGASITLPGSNTLYKTGFSFAGWGETQTAVSVLTGSFTPSTRIILFPQWTPNVYVVTYNANGGNGAPTAASQNYTSGSANLALSTKGTLTRTGYTFAGWNTLATGLGTNYLENASYKPTVSIILYAKWTANTYTLTYNANGGTTNSTAVITAGTPLTLSTTAGTRTGFTLAGWNTAADGSGSSFAGATSQTYYSDVTLYALWTPAVPGAPTVSAVTAGNTTATATITPVAASGTTVGPPASFTVQAFDSTGTTAIIGKTCTVLATASPLSCVITGLTNGTTYKFKATAINATGSTTGAASTVTAIPAPFVVTYSLNGGTLATATANYTLGTPLTLPLPTRTGYTFTGWNNPTSVSVGIDGASYSPATTITLTAQWSANTYTITYNGNGSDSGTVTSAASFTFGNSYSIAAKGTMTKSGYNFAGWTTASNGTGTLYANATDSIASSAATYTAASNLTVYAKWTPQVYVITYNTNGATGSPSRATDSFTFGTTPISLPDKTGMTYAGYTFVGWSETTSGTAVVNPYSPTQTRTLYAIWAGISYSISYNVNGGTGSVADATYTTGATGVTLNNGSSLTRSGYDFAGWKNVAGTTVSTSAYTPTDNVTVYAIWNPKSIAVTYDRGIATTTTAFPSATNVAFGANLTLSSGVDVSTTISATNYLFAGWAINGVTYKSGDTYRVSSEAPITVTAQWLRLFDVRYNVNGGTLATNDLVTDAECITAGLCIDTQVITLNAAPARDGFTFNGWNNQGGTLVVDSDPAIAGIQTGLTDSNYIFYASWTANSYTITFAAGTGSNGNAQAITDSHGAIVQLAASTGYSLAGSVFTGWLIGGVTYPAGAFYTMGTNASPITATAQYANNTFKIFYNTNGATSGVTPTATSAVQGANIIFNDATGFSRTGYTFEGWSDGTAVRAAGYATTMGSANATVIAEWKIAIPVTPTISSVTGSDGGVSITVAAAASGGAPSSYVVTASPGGATCTVFAPATTCSISPLTNGTAYTFSVTASNSTGTSAAATSASVTPAAKPDAPTGVIAVRGNTQATVSFTAVTGTATGGPAISSYTITAYDANNNAVGTPCQTASSATSCVVTGLTNGTPYTFKATANNGRFTSAASAESTAVIPATVPNAPTSVTAAVTTAGAATVSFTAPLDNGGTALTGFTVTSSPGGFTCTAAASATSCVVSGLTNGTAYTFTAVATNEIGNSVASSATTSVTPQTAASAPSTITATAGDGQASVAFSGAVTNGSSIADYTVQAYDSNGNAVTGATCTSATSPCTVTGLANGSTYTFKVVTNSTVYGAASTTASTPSIASNAVTPATAPSAPTGVEVTSGTGKVTVSWTAAAANGSTILSYQVQAYDADGNAVTGATCIATAPATTCDVSANLAAGSNYTFKVTATSAAGTSTGSTASAAAAINAAPSAPRNVVATPANASASVTWDAPSNINGSALTGYTATAYTAGNVIAGMCTSTVVAESCVITGLTNGTPYTFKVVATNGIGTSAQSLASSAATPSTVPNAPTAVTAAMGDASARVSFLAPTNNGGSDVTSYTVTSSPGNFTCTVNAPATSCNVTGLTNGTAYTFTVKASNANGASIASTASASGTPVESSAPTLANPGQPTGNPYVGSTLTSNVSFNGSPTPTVTYQWKVCTDPADRGTCTDISGATSATYVPTSSELGKYIVIEATATNGVGSPLTEISNPTLVIKPEIDFSAPSPIPSGTAGTAYSLSTAAAGGVGTFTYTVSNGTLPAGLSLNPATGQISGTPTAAGTYTFTVRATDSNGVYKDVVISITIAAAPSVPVVVPTPTPAPVTCDAACVAAKAAADKAAADAAAAAIAAAAKAAADKAAADKAAADKAAADKAAADKAAAAKAASDNAANAASAKAAADAAAAAAAAKAAIDKAAAAAVAKAAADAAAKIAADQAKAAAAAQAAAAKAAADAATALKNSTTTAAAKAAATASANKAAADAAAAVKAAATAAQQAAVAKNVATNATKQVDIAINSLNSKTAAAQSSAQANAIAAAAKAAADASAKAAADSAAAAQKAAAAAQKAAADTAARIVTEQKQAADAAAAAKVAADAAAKATAEKVATAAAATKAAEDLAKVLADKAALAEQAAKATSEADRAEIQKKIVEVTTKAEDVQKTVEAATIKAESAATAQSTATQNADAANKEAQTQAAEVVAVKAESVTKNTEAAKAAATSTVAAKIATAAKAAAAKVPAKAVPTPTPSTSASKNSATATVSGLKPGQKIKVTVNVNGR